MFSNSLGRFLRDERGSYTIWSVIWFMAYVAVGGLALDVTDAYRHQSLLQATADAAALAGAMSLHDGNAVSMAQTYAKANMEQNLHGTVLRPSDVKLGRWDFDNEVFIDGADPPNAVYVTTRRMEQNYNPVAWNFLRILSLMGLDAWWNIQAEAVAGYGVDVCENNGMIAQKLDFRTWTNFQNGLCLIGTDGFNLAGQGASQSTFDETVYIGVGCEPEDKKCIGHGTNPWNNDDFTRALNDEPDDREPHNAQNVGEYLSMLLALAKGEPVSFYDNEIGTFDSLSDFSDAMITAEGISFSGWKYLVTDSEDKETWRGLEPPEYVHVDAESGGLEAVAADNDGKLPRFKVYEVDCPNSGYSLPMLNYENVAVVANCPIDMRAPDGSLYTMTDSLFASTYSAGNKAAVQAGPNVNWGTESAKCMDGIELYSLGDVDFAADQTILGSRMLVDGDVHFAASPDGPADIHIEATGKIFQASGAYPGTTWGLCGDYLKNGPMFIAYGLLR